MLIRGLVQIPKLLPILAVACVMSACGGGGGGSSHGGGNGLPPPSQNQPPTANAGDDQTVKEQSVVTLDGAASFDPDGDSVTFLWEQTAGDSIKLDDATSAKPSFTASELFEVGSVESLEFRLTLSDGRGGSNSDIVTINVEVDIPDSDRFLTYLNRSSALFQETKASADAYYAAIDPTGAKTTLDDWRAANGFGQGDDARAVYRNAADLGFGRVMALRKNSDGSVAAYVENYASLDGAVNAELTNSRDQLLATVAMEYSRHPDFPNEPMYTKFYTFLGPVLAAEKGVPPGTRVTEIDLDGRGDKFQPGVCNICHGGQPKPLVNGAYPDNGDTNAQFLPWDLDTFEFSDDPVFTRAAQEGEFKKLNQGALATYPAASIPGRWSGDAARELVHGWYGDQGSALPAATFNGDFVPSGWRAPANGGPSENPPNSEEIYLDVVGPNCRACHVQRGRTYAQNDVPGQEGRKIDFATYQSFMDYEEEIVDLVFDHGQMPDARLTFDNFWSDQSGIVAAELLAEHLNIDLDEKALGRPVADPGPDMNAPLGTPFSFVELNGKASRFAKTFSWSFAEGSSKPAGSDAVITSEEFSTPTLIVDRPGSYRLQLIVGNGLTLSEPETVVVTAFNGINERSFSGDVAPLLISRCVSCHGASGIPGIPVLFDDLFSRYERVLSYVDLENVEHSPILRKPSGHVHGGGLIRGDANIADDGFDLRVGFDNGVLIDGGGYDKILEWISQGAKNN